MGDTNIQQIGELCTISYSNEPIIYICNIAFVITLSYSKKTFTSNVVTMNYAICRYNIF